MTQSGGGFFSGEQQIFSCFFYFKMSWSLSDVAVCNVEARNCASNHATVSTNTPGMTSNRLCVRWQLERPEGEHRLIITHHPPSGISCLEFHLEVEKTSLETCVSGPERIVSTIWICTSTLRDVLYANTAPKEHPTHFPSFFINTAKHSPRIPGVNAQH